MNKIQNNQTEIKKEKKTNAFKRFFDKHETAIGITMAITLTSTATLGAGYYGVKKQEDNLVYKDVEIQNVKEDKSETIKFKEPLSKGTYSISEDLAHKMFGELEQKTEIKIGDETFYFLSFVSLSTTFDKDKPIVILKNKETGKRVMVYEDSVMEVKVNGETKMVSITLDTVDTKEDKKLNGIKINY